MRKPWILPLIAAVALTAVGGCTLPEPYVYKADEFNRESREFGKAPKDRTSVGICYNRKNTTPRHITEMAQAECAKYGKVARFSTQKRLECPVLTPMEAIFLCETQARNDLYAPFRY